MPAGKRKVFITSYNSMLLKRLKYCAAMMIFSAVKAWPDGVNMIQ